MNDHPDNPFTPQYLEGFFSHYTEKQFDEALERNCSATELFKDALPETWIKTVRNFIFHGITPGSATMAMLQDSFCHAVLRSHGSYQQALRPMALFLYEHVPHQVRGPKAVQWMQAVRDYRDARAEWFAS